MAIEELPDTTMFRRVRIPLTDFIEFPRSPVTKEGIKKQIPLEYPEIHFRSRNGLYLCSDFYSRFYRHLRPRPECPKVESIFVWTLRRSCVWSVARSNFEGGKQPVPWWVIRPFLKYVSTGERGTLLPSSYPAPFFMEARGDDDATFEETVSLQLSFGTLHTEWWLGLFPPKEKEQCYEGQTFLSVA